MQVRTRHTPSYAVARLLLGPGEPAWAEPGAMLATSYGVAVETRSQGGLWKSLTRAASGDQAGSGSTFTAPHDGGWVDVAPSLPGDLGLLELDERTGWCVRRGCWLASASGVTMTTGWAGFRALFGGENGFLTHASGRGPVVLACFGALEVVTLPPGEFITIDAGHVVAYAESVQTRLRQVHQGAAQSMRSGEGLVLDFAGPGQVWTQTRDPRALLSWLRTSGSGP